MKRAITYMIFGWLGLTLGYGQSFRTELHGAIEQYRASSEPLRIALVGYNGKQTAGLDTATVDKEGRFVLHYPTAYRGLGVMQIMGTQVEIPLVLIADAKAEQGLLLAANGKLSFTANSPNAVFHAYQQNTDNFVNRLSNLEQLNRYYDPTKGFGLALAQEQQVLEASYANLRNEIDTLSSDVGYFVRLQESLNSMNTLLRANSQPPMEKLQAAQRQFEKAVSFADERLWHSGILHRLIYSYYSVSAVLEGGYQRAGDFLAAQLANSPHKTTYLEEIIGVVQSQPAIAEYFSQKMLAANEQCDDIKGNDIPGKIKRQLEQYSLLKVGMPAPDEMLDNGKRISEVPGTHKLIVFWASWCDHCQKEIPELVAMYPDLKKQHIEVVAMGMDDNAQIHRIVSQAHPWVSHFVGRDWNAPVSQDYRIFGTPTFFLVDKDMKIVAKPKSVADLMQGLNRTKM